ncbi:glycosyltransferase [Flavobacterium quisquiliarum]|uniref:Glycosyltransferase n=1 Tax=Flavobacterium quisquiliarum TaxID=1834436 RepID=A0ABV8WCY1_9FLAO|nr:glycosyltransferase [Flavobacterium quisquiliarum]MBW1657715.1 mannosyltransferase [Flavobacterium quisquiliarum]NWL04054.1 mannosyltransferase [Flavobacterium collinsii]
MITKKIHYCWFGKEAKSKVFQDCLVSWKLHCPDFEIIMWNEFNTTKYSNPFYKNALRKKKYAFAADYIRAKVLHEQGGVYLDTDIFLIKPLNDLLKYDFFIGEEIEGRTNFAIFGAVPNHRFLKEMIDFYDRTEFNVFSLPVITHTFCSLINRTSVIENEIILAPSFFYPLPYEKRIEDYKSFIVSETYAVHLWEHSWKKREEPEFLQLFKNLIDVIIDFIFYNYSYSYFKRYGKEFSRKIYHSIKQKIKL